MAFCLDFFENFVLRCKLYYWHGQCLISFSVRVCPCFSCHVQTVSLLQVLNQFEPADVGVPPFQHGRSTAGRFYASGIISFCVEVKSEVVCGIWRVLFPNRNTITGMFLFFSLMKGGGGGGFKWWEHNRVYWVKHACFSKTPCRITTININAGSFLNQRFLFE